MAKLHKIELYIVDPTGDTDLQDNNESNLKYLLRNWNSEFKVETIDFEWDDKHPLNLISTTLEEKRKYFTNHIIISSMIGEYLKGYYLNGMPKLTCFSDEAIIFNYEDAKKELNKLHSMGFTGLEII
jgi:hypothetical protein